MPLGLHDDSIVRIEGLTKRFGAITAVDGIDLEIRRGELFALLGGSGCGKTTLLRMLAGFETPDGGRIVIDGQDMTGVPPYRRPVNMMFQSYALFPHMDVAANVGYGLRRDGVAAPEIAKRVAEALEQVKLSDHAARRPAQLSGGQRQRVALARALVKRPKLLLLDEPLAALDRKLREGTRFELVRLQEELGLTFVMVTHDQEEAMSMATRLAVMNAGRVAQTGTPHDIYEQPATRFVADFIGIANILQADGGWLALRPEKITLSATCPDAAHVATGNSRHRLRRRPLPLSRRDRSLRDDDRLDDQHRSPPTGRLQPRPERLARLVGRCRAENSKNDGDGGLRA